MTTFLKMKKPEANALGHVIGIKRGLMAGERYSYYFGSAWSCYDVQTEEEWELRIHQFLRGLYAPLEVSIK